MTIPWLENCAHAPHGWCLACVKQQHERIEWLEERLHKADGMANEINLLVKENRALHDRLKHYEACAFCSKCADARAIGAS